MKLWFENSNGEERVIAEVNDWPSVWKAINNFIDSCNAAKPTNVKPFKSYYSRIWRCEDGRSKIDIGSHTEFFYTDIDYTTINDDSQGRQYDSRRSTHSWRRKKFVFDR